VASKPYPRGVGRRPLAAGVREGRSTQRAKAGPREGCGGGDDVGGRAGRRRRRRSARVDRVREDSCPRRGFGARRRGAWGLGVANYLSTLPPLKLIKLIIFGEAPRGTTNHCKRALLLNDKINFTHIIIKCYYTIAKC